MAVDLVQAVRAHLVDLCANGLLDRKGQPRKGLYVRQGGKSVLPPLGGFLGPISAYLSMTPFDGNPFGGSDALMRIAFDAGDRLLLDHAAVTAQTKPNHFTIFPLAYLYDMLGEQAGKARLARWREAMARNLRSVDALIDRAWETLGKPGPYSGTGPNHFFGWFAVGCHQAQVLGERAVEKKIERAMLKHVEVQSAAGYFPEHKGPAVLYQHVSLGGLAEFHRLHPLPATRRAIERGVDFLIRASYPDLHGIDTFDERNRFGSESWLQAGLCWTPAGRRMLLRGLEKTRESRPVGGDPFAERPWGPWGMGGAFRCFLHAQATDALPVSDALPTDRERFAWRLEDKGLVRRQAPWFYALSSMAHDVEHGNPYHLERTQALSIYHDAAGLIVGGGNDKHAYRNATIHILEGGDCNYFPGLHSRLRVNVPAKILSGKGSCDRVEFDYGSARADLEIRAESASRLRIGLGVWTSQTQPKIWLGLQLPGVSGLTLVSNGKRLVLKPAREGQETTDYPLGLRLKSPTGWGMSLPKGSTLLWPHLPWNPYRPAVYRETLDKAVAIVRVPLHEHDWRAEVVVSAGG